MGEDDLIELVELTGAERKILKEVVEDRIRQLPVLRSNATEVERKLLEEQAPILHDLRERL